MQCLKINYSLSKLEETCTEQFLFNTLSIHAVTYDKRVNWSKNSIYHSPGQKWWCLRHFLSQKPGKTSPIPLGQMRRSLPSSPDFFLGLPNGSCNVLVSASGIAPSPLEFAGHCKVTNEEYAYFKSRFKLIVFMWCHHIGGSVAEWLGRRTWNPKVVGSSPALTT